jgi:hypothetical protein
MQRKLILGIGAGLIALSSLFGAIACDDDEDDGTATDTPSADETMVDEATATP